MIRFIKQVANLWQIRKAPTPYEKGLLQHLNIHPNVRSQVKRFHCQRAERLVRAFQARKISMEEFKRRSAIMRGGLSAEDFAAGAKRMGS